jgi:protein-tyrosine-phosphatase
MAQKLLEKNVGEYCIREEKNKKDNVGAYCIRPEEDIEVYSCGTNAETGAFATYNAIAVMEEYNIDLNSHRATNIIDSKIQEMDLVLCMSKSNKDAVLYMYPELKEKVFTLKEYAGYDKADLNISDPWGAGLSTYRFCAAEINECIEKIEF